MRYRSSIFIGAGKGLLAGIGLGLFFKWIEFNGIANVYTLLLNVDFIPNIPQPLPEWIEFSLHLVVSVAIGIVYQLLNVWRFKPWSWGILMGIVPVPLFIPLTLMSARTPAIDDTSALVWWVVGHLLYGASLPVFSIVVKKVGQ